MPYFESNGTTLYYQETGSGPVVILIPGMGADHRDWTLQRIFLKKHFKLIAVDNRGIGKSREKDFEITIKGMASDIGTLIKSIKTDMVHIVGHSMGSMIALEYAIQNPHRISSLVLSSLPIHGSSNDCHKVLDDLNTLLDNGCQAIFAQKFLSSLFSTEFQKSDQFNIINELICKSNQNYDLPIIQRQLKAIQEWSDSWGLNRLCGCPCLFVHGSEDKFIFSSKHYSKLSGLFPKAKFDVIKGGGHAVHVEKAKEFNEIVCRFINEHKN